MSKKEADNLIKISTTFLKKNGYFDGWRSGTIAWTSGLSEQKSSVGIEVSTKNGDNYLRITYAQTELDGNSKRNFDYKILLTTTLCRYGGRRHWFLCPWYKNGVYCGKRVGTLYKHGDYFACRHCYDLTYKCRNLSGYNKILGKIISTPELEMLESEVKRRYYRGKQTKKYMRFLRKDRKASNSIIELASMLQKMDGVIKVDN